MKYSKETLSRLGYLAGITLTMMGLVLEGIFAYMIGYPYWLERDMVETKCVAQKRDLLDRAASCQTSEKARSGQFPCYRIDVAFLDTSPGSAFDSTTTAPPTSAPAGDHGWVHRGLKGPPPVRFAYNGTGPWRLRAALLYQSYFEWKEAAERNLPCAVAPCNISTPQNFAQTLAFVKQFATLDGRPFTCYQSDSFDPQVVLVHLLANEVPSVSHLLAWPLVIAALGILSLVANTCLVGCGVWKDAILV